MSNRVRIYLSVAVLVFVGIWVLRRSMSSDSSAARPVDAGHPPIAIALPPFTLTNQDAKSVTREDLRGKVTVVDFIFTKCPTICPELTRKMSALAKQAKDDDIRFVSISVDPENDTPSVLRAYGERYGADFTRWSFLTGDQKAMEETVLGGFKVAYQKDAAGSIAHAERFVLVDREATIRGYFDADDASQRRLLESARALAD
jgi:protein SCO1